MPSFTIRIELHDAIWQHYVDLARNLKAIGITDTIVAGDGKKYRLSPAEYNYEGNSTLNDVFLAASGAAALVVPKYAVFVTESGGTGRIWAGLEQIP